MRLCPACGKTFDDRLSFCPIDATALSGTRPGQETPPLPQAEPAPAAGPGQFFLGERLRESPTGTLYEASPAEGGPELLLKHVAAAAFPSPALRDRALRELRHLMGAVAPSLLPVLGCGLLPDGALYVSMAPLPPGAEPLDERVRGEGFLDVDQARHIALQVGGALEVALRRGVLHRSLAPYAVYVDDGDDAVLIDFGLSEFHEVSWRLVQGPVPFLAPEQAQGRAATERSLVYGLGALYYYMLVGLPPHGEGEAEALLRRITTATASPPSQRRPGLSPEIDKLVQKALDRAPEKRHATVAELLDELERLGDIQPPRTSASPTPGWMLPSLEESDPDEITAQVAEEDLVAVSWVDAPSVTMAGVEGEEGEEGEEEDDEDLHSRSTLPLPTRRQPSDLTP